MPLLVTATLAAAISPAEPAAGIPSCSIPIYLVLIVSVTLAYAYFVHSRFSLFAGVANGVIAGGRLLVEFTAILERILRGAVPDTSWPESAGFCWPF